MAPDIFAILRAEHRVVLDRIKEVERAAGGEARGAAFGRLREELGGHTVAERDVLYARLRELPLARRSALEAEQEHHVVTTLLRELDRMKPSSERFLAKLHVLKEIVRHHLDEEESELFPMARQVLAAAEIDALTRRYLDRRSAVAP